MGFFSRLTARARAVNSLLCIGLDPRAPTAAEAQAECERLIVATAPYAAAFKPNSAFFEQFGAEGMAALKAVIATVPDGIPVVLDVKRGDIASTADAYARAAYDELGADAVTLNPYMGIDAITPFLADDKGVFVLCKTSNPSADEIQGLPVQQQPLYQQVALVARRWASADQLGLVVGATDPAALATVRMSAPERWILAPGIGAQGGDVVRAVQSGLRTDGLGLLLPVSRGVSAAADPAEAARSLRDQINRAREDVQPQPTGGLPALAQVLLDTGCVKFGQFTLKSGKASPIYLDLRRLVSYPAAMQTVGMAYARLLRSLEYDHIAGIPFAALPIAVSIGLQLGQSVIYPRPPKQYGTQATIEGAYAPGQVAVVVDDLATTGETKIEAIDNLKAAGLVVQDVVVLIDRDAGAGKYLAERGYHYHAVVSLRQLLTLWYSSGAIDAAQLAEVEAFLQS